MEGVQAISLSLGYVMGQAMRAAAQLGVADELAAGPRSVDELAAATGTHAPSLRRLLRTLSSGGFFSADGDGRLTLTSLGTTLRRDVPGSVRDAVIWVGDPIHYATCGDLAETVTTGHPAFDRLYGRPYFELFADDEPTRRMWDDGMACFSGIENGPIAQAYPFPAGSCVVDVGGGQGGLLAAVLATDPTLRGVLFDLPDVVAAPRALADAGMLDRCRTVGGDFFQSVPPGGDVYVLKRVLHDWDDPTCVDLLRRCREVVPTDGRLLAIEAVIPPDDEPHPAKIVDLIMMGILAGRERTEAEFAELLAAAGFTIAGVIPTHSMLSIVDARPS
jgi:hypothetical protein